MSLILQLFLLIILSLLSSVLGRAGGMSKDPSALPTWIPVWLRQHWVRDWLCPFCALALPFMLHPSWWFVLAYGFMGLSLTTYWDKLFGYDNFYFSGFVVGASTIFLINFFPWFIILAYALSLATSWGLLNYFINKKSYPDGTEELVRYFLLTFLIIFFII